MLRIIYKKIAGYEPCAEIPNSRLLLFYFSKFFSLVRGFFLLNRRKIFLGKKSKILSKKLLKNGNWLNIGDNVFIDALSSNGVFLGNHVSIGKNTRIECTGSFSCLGKGFKCGDNCGLGTDSFYGAAGGIEIGNDVIIGNNVSFHSENHNFSELDKPIRLQDVNHKGIRIGNDCWIGAKVTVLDGSIVGDGCVIAAGAVVRGQFPNDVVIGGVPAKIIKYRS